ncbi:S1-like domain-containing RNA-binding protein [Paraglaciecola chathamensis]|uniref:CvfB family protein n=1 Tax=Paraglaciecola chathamensis TaxID=368405 RepID=UPI0027018585|nr:S1-like domain-containing RNA-binding protein [Paraglaciecola chathamensis]MDO6839305.1 S1-like domain-containing RNA-binding protein [Paraglaciecola chathamensis]
MLQIGKFNSLKVIKQVPFGFYLDGGDDGEVLLPTKFAEEACKVGDTCQVFVYHDSDSRLIATTQTPLAQVDECAFLKVVSVNNVGAFLDWGIDKDILVPYSEQDFPMAEGVSYVVFVYFDDETGRVAASTRLRDFLFEEGKNFDPKQEVDLLICGRSDMGYKAVINGSHLGLIFKDEVFKPLRIGQRTTGFIKRVREDNKIDLCFQFHDDGARNDLAEQIIDDLEAHGGISTLTDKSSAQEISKRFNVSKNVYKKALGALYKQKRILLDKSKVTLIK